MDTTTSIKPKTMAELMPGLSGILSKDSMLSLTAKKQPRQTMVQQSRTAEKVSKPLTLAEMRAGIMALKIQSPRPSAQAATTSRKKNWNSSVKVDSKTVSHTANGQLKNNPVRKVLNFQPKCKPPSNRVSMMATETPKFPKPEFRPKKSMILQARTNVRISGIYNISETPVVNKPIMRKVTIANKENMSNQSSIKKTAPPKLFTHTKLIPTVPDTPLSNESWKSSCDASFLQKEKEIDDIEEKNRAIAEERTLENIAEVTPPVSTPFKEYRSVQDFFNNTNEVDSSAVCHDDTIMCFDKTTAYREENKREESVIVSLCDLLNKATMNTIQKNTEHEDLVKIEKQTELNIKMIENSIATLNKIRESHVASLESIRKLIRTNLEKDKADTTLTETEQAAKDVIIKIENETPEKIVISKPKASPVISVIKSAVKSPSYKIPKKNLCLRKKVFYKSMPNVSNDTITPVKSDMGNRALSMYMKMKEHMNFLNTPVATRRCDIPDTPGVTSHNLQKQLDKLYDEN